MTLPPLLFSYYEYNNLFARGAGVYKRLFCGDFTGLGQAMAMGGDSVPLNASTRAHFESLTPKSSSCFACHERFNAIGFNLEDYDNIGEKRNGIEFQYSSTGTVTKQAAFEVEGHLAYMGKFYYTPNSRDLFDTMYNKGVLKKCATKQLGQFFLKLENLPDNKCALEKINGTSATKIKEVIFEILVSDSFTKSKIP